MGRPSKQSTLEGVTQMDTLDCKQFVRGIGLKNQRNAENNIWPIQEIDQYVDQFLKQGYKLLSVQTAIPYNPASDATYLLYTMVKQ